MLISTVSQSVTRKELASPLPELLSKVISLNVNPFISLTLNTMWVEVLECSNLTKLLSPLSPCIVIVFTKLLPGTLLNNNWSSYTPSLTLIVTGHVTPALFNAKFNSLKLVKSGFTPPNVYTPHKEEYKVVWTVSFNAYKSACPLGCSTQILISFGTPEGKL